MPGVPVNKDAGQAPAAAVAAAEPEGAKAAAGELPTDQEQVVRRNSGTRTRRLSYITNDVSARGARGAPLQHSLKRRGRGGGSGAASGLRGLSQRLLLGPLLHVGSWPTCARPRAPSLHPQNDIAARQAAGYDDGGEDEADAPPAPPRNGVLLSAACLSRAGREPGYKKTNQDSCFAFEKYISDDGALFGAMDGHGPHGAHRRAGAGRGGAGRVEGGCMRCRLFGASAAAQWAQRPRSHGLSLSLTRASAPAPAPVVHPPGHLVSSFVKQHLPVALVAHLTSGAAVTRALTGGFLEVDARLGSSRIDCEFSGSTCVVAYVKVRAPGCGGRGGKGRGRGRRHCCSRRLLLASRAWAWPSAE